MALEAEPDPLLAVLDAARSDRILELLRESPEEFRSLYITDEDRYHWMGFKPYVFGDMAHNGIIPDFGWEFLRG